MLDSGNPLSCLSWGSLLVTYLVFSSLASARWFHSINTFGYYCTLNSAYQVQCRKCARLEAVSLNKTDVIPGLVESSGNVITLPLIYLNSNKTASERFHVGTIIQIMTSCMLVLGKVSSSGIDPKVGNWVMQQHSNQLPANWELWESMICFSSKLLSYFLTILKFHSLFSLITKAREYHNQELTVAETRKMEVKEVRSNQIVNLFLKYILKIVWIFWHIAQGIWGNETSQWLLPVHREVWTHHQLRGKASTLMGSLESRSEVCFGTRWVWDVLYLTGDGVEYRYSVYNFYFSSLKRIKLKKMVKRYKYRILLPLFLQNWRRPHIGTIWQ